jgi:hypothetical protein
MDRDSIVKLIEDECIFVCLFSENSKNSFSEINKFIVDFDAEYISAHRVNVADIYGIALEPPATAPMILDFRKIVGDELLNYVLDSFYNRKFPVQIGEDSNLREITIDLSRRPVFIILKDIRDISSNQLRNFSHVINNDILVKNEIKVETVKSSPPAVYPMTQDTQLENGEFISRRIRPLTLTLLILVTRHLRMPDTIDISDDEMLSEWNVTIGEACFPLYINCIEGQEIYTIDVYFGAVPEDKLIESLILINQLNCQIDAGHFQYTGGGIRYHHSVDVSDIAPKDPEYQGPHILPPKILINMFESAKYIVEAVAPYLKPCLE